MPHFRKKPVVIEAMQFSGGNFSEIEEFCGGDAEFRAGRLVVATLDGPLYASNYDWIIKEGGKGELSSCNPERFAATYEPVQHDDSVSGNVVIINGTRYV